MERNYRLEEARRKKGWSVREASRQLGVHRNTISAWEAGTSTPQISLLRVLCQTFNATTEELGLEHVLHAKQKLTQAVSFAEETTTLEQREAVSASERGILIFEDLEVRLLIVVGQWDRRSTSYDELQVKIAQQIRSYDDMTDHRSIENPERRKALRILASLPVGIYGLTVLGSTKTVHADEFLPSCAAGLTACWQLSKGSDLALVRDTVSSYLPTLTLLAKQPSHHQKAAAGLTAQCHMLMGLMSMHLDSLVTAKAHHSKAVTYSQLAEDNNLLGAALCWLSSIPSYDKRYSDALKICERALPTVDNMLPNARSNVYLNLAKYYAQCEQKQDSLRALGLAHEAYARDTDGGVECLYACHDRFTLTLQDGETYYHLKEYRKALSSYKQIDGLQPRTSVPERVRLEFLNNQALTALRLGELEESCKYLTIAATGAITLKSERRYAEAYDIFDKMDFVWSGEPQVRALKDIFKKK